MTKSIIQPEEKRCFLCGRSNGLERHHVLGGVANRKLSEKYGLWVWLCAVCHRGTDGAQYDPEKNQQLKKDAQVCFERRYGHQMWMEIFRKNYL